MPLTKPAYPAIDGVRRMVVLRGGGMGDLLMTMPALESLKARCPAATLTLLGTPGAVRLLGGRPGPVDEVLPLPVATGVYEPLDVVANQLAERAKAAEVARRAWLPADSVLAGGTSLAALAALVAEARLLICADTGVSHLSYAYGTPSVVLFGPAPPSRWGPPPRGPHVTLTRDELRRGDPFAADPDPAILGVDPAAVVDAARRLLARTAAYRA